MKGTEMLLEYSQILLFSATLLTIVAFTLYLLAVTTAWRHQKGHLGHVEGAQVAAPAAKGAAWYGRIFVVLAFLALTVAWILRWIYTGTVPLANQYEFATSFCWGMLLFQLYFDHKYKVRLMALFTLPVIIAMLIYCTQLSYDRDPLMPALQNSPLLTMHVFSASLSYGAAVVALGAAIMYLLAPHVKWKSWPKQELLDEIGYKAVVFTFPLLTIMIILGSIWANIAWGRYWAWDPKETAGLVTWLIYGAYLHARVVRGWRGNKSAWLLVVGFLAIIFTFFGNYWFGGLHSYA